MNAAKNVTFSQQNLIVFGAGRGKCPWHATAPAVIHATCALCTWGDGGGATTRGCFYNLKKSYMPQSRANSPKVVTPARHRGPRAITEV